MCLKYIALIIAFMAQSVFGAASSESETLKEHAPKSCLQRAGQIIRGVGNFLSASIMRIMFLKKEEIQEETVTAQSLIFPSCPPELTFRDPKLGKVVPWIHWHLLELSEQLYVVTLLFPMHTQKQKKGVLFLKSALSF